MKARAICIDESVQDIKLDISKADKKTVIRIAENPDYSKIKYIDIGYDVCHGKAEDSGYMVIPQSRSSEDGMLINFKAREDMIFEGGRLLGAFMHGVKGKNSFVLIASGAAFIYSHVVEVKDNNYYLYSRFKTDLFAPEEPIELTVFHLEHGKDTYSDMAVLYRNFMIEKGELVPIKQRLNQNLSYACDSVYVRIRQGWKPVPSVIEEQTIENEPDMYVACTFSQVEEIMQAYKENGIEKAEFCLVGWNIKGHDGRWPTALPVEESLGGEEGLKRVIKKAKDLGYSISCHTNSTDAYTISKYYSDDDIRIDKNGKIAKHDAAWSGGKARWVCASKYLKNAKKILPDVARFGFNGLHYIDVVGILGLGRCYSKVHPLSEWQTAACMKELACYAKQLFGGYSTEGACAHHAPVTDYGLYISFCDTSDNYYKEFPVCDKRIPLWSIIYHGIVLSNPYTSTVNLTLKGEKAVLEAIERGARPSIYFNSKFVDKKDNSDMTNWMGDVDFYNSTKEQIDFAAKSVGEFYKTYKNIAHLQKEMILAHHEIEENVFEVVYENGEKITVDYNRMTFDLSNAL